MDQYQLLSAIYFLRNMRLGREAMTANALSMLRSQGGALQRQAEQIEAMLDGGSSNYRPKPMGLIEWAGGGSRDHYGQSIADFTSDLRRIASHELVGEDERASLERTCVMYEHLGEQHGARTVGEALQVIRDGKVNVQLVELWVRNGMCINHDEYSAVASSPKYVHLRPLMDKIRRELQ